MASRPQCQASPPNWAGLGLVLGIGSGIAAGILTRELALEATVVRWIRHRRE